MYCADSDSLAIMKVLMIYTVVWLINNKTCSTKPLQVNSPWGEAKWAIDLWPLRVKGKLF